mgnify:CR=1 FL=1
MSKTLDLGCGPNPKNPLNADEVFNKKNDDYFILNNFNKITTTLLNLIIDL